MHVVHWRPRRRAVEPGRCYHHASVTRTARQAPVVGQKVLGVMRPVLALDIAIRECCIEDDPAARVAWWDAVLDALPGLLAGLPELPEGWLLAELASIVPWPTDEDAVVTQLLKGEKVPGRTAYRQETEYPRLVEAAQRDARRLLGQGGHRGGRGPGALGVAAVDAYVRQTFGGKALKVLDAALDGRTSR
jgi:hypothetical protein